MTYNGLAYNGLSYNGLSYYGLSYNGLCYSSTGLPFLVLEHLEAIESLLKFGLGGLARQTNRRHEALWLQ